MAAETSLPCVGMTELCESGIVMRGTQEAFVASMKGQKSVILLHDRLACAMSMNDEVKC